MNSETCVIITTCDLKEIAYAIATNLVEHNLAKCVQIDNVHSIYKWEGKICNNDEYRIVIKAQSAKYLQIQESILKIHNYELPQILKINIADGLPAYLEWISSEV